ncbi:MAG: YbhB/YbcL family Raf kinase inhibitor-like protein [Candidatus Yanofskybacteria bacterium]|nr:YbhB/YbcL family Raf kinase inhibitor-like protein [Candidatus Yanofskybacteria bacterium]
MKLISSAFGHNEQIPGKYTCEGEDINPPLEIHNVPDSAKSLVLIMEDPDVPKHLRADGMWDHWVKFNIPPATKMIPEGEEPEGVSGAGTSGNLGYHGPCPSNREHRYFFQVYALDEELPLREGAAKRDVEAAMAGHILEEAVLIGLYEKKSRGERR